MTPPRPSAKPAWAIALKRRREEAVGSQEELAARADMSQSLVSQIERGVQSPAGLSVDRFARLLNALAWTAPQFSQATGIDLGTLTGRTSAHEALQPVADVHAVPVRTLTAAGQAFYSDDAVIDFDYVSPQNHRPGMLIVQVAGDSMQPTIFNDDWVYIDTNSLDVIDGRIYMIHIHGDGFILKRARQVAGNWLLMSDNPSHAPLSPSEATVVGLAYYHQPRGNRLA